MINKVSVEIYLQFVYTINKGVSYHSTANKDVVNIFNFFKKKREVERESEETSMANPKAQARETLESARASLEKIETIMFSIKEQELFTGLLAFVAYYSTIIQFYLNDIEAIISVNELLLFKYIDMIHDILANFDEKYATREQKEEFSSTLYTINEKLYGTIKNIKEQQKLDLNVDLKTIRDLVKLDF